MTVTRARYVLFWLFLVGFVIQTAAFFAVYKKHYIYADEFGKLMTSLLKTYSPHMGIILGGILVKRGKDKSTEGYSFQIAFITALIWNSLLLLVSIPFGFFAQGEAKNVLEHLDLVSVWGSCFIAAALAFFFAKQ